MYYYASTILMMVNVIGIKSDAIVKAERLEYGAKDIKISSTKREQSRKV